MRGYASRSILGHSLNQTPEGPKAASLLERGLGHAEAAGKPDRHLAAFALNINSVVRVTDRAERTSGASRRDQRAPARLTRA
jgi:hypothetical protein